MRRGQNFDFFAASRPGAATPLFFHGGYCQRNAKEGSSFIAEGPLAQSFHIAVADYTLAPQARMDGISASRALRSIGCIGISRHWPAIRRGSMSAVGRPVAISPPC